MPGLINLLKRWNDFLRKIGSDRNFQENVPPVSPQKKDEDPTALDTSMSGWFKEETGELIEGFKISAEDVVLDVGCGDSLFAAFCGEQCAEIILADIDAKVLKIAEARVRNTKARAVRALITDANPLPVDTGSVTKIIVTEVLEHVDDPVQLLQEVVRVGQAGALYLISVPDPVPEHLQKDIAAPAHFQKPNHIRIFERDQFKALIERSGLIVERETSYGFYWAMWWMFFWACKQDLSAPWHPLLAAWSTTWSELLNTQQGPQIKKVLDEFMPKSQAIIARKPSV